MSGLNPALIERVKAAAASELIDLAERAGYKWPAKSYRRGRKLHCPFHSDKTASAHRYEDRIHCFGCCESRDVIDLEQLSGGGTFSDAVLRLAARHGIAVESANAHVPVRPRFDAATLGEAELFLIGLIWHTERELEAAKRTLLESPGEVDGELIYGLTQTLTGIEQLSQYDAAVVCADLKTNQPGFVAELVAEVKEAHALLMNVLCLAGQSAEVPA